MAMQPPRVKKADGVITKMGGHPTIVEIEKRDSHLLDASDGPPFALPDSFTKQIAPNRRCGHVTVKHVVKNRIDRCPRAERHTRTRK